MKNIHVLPTDKPSRLFVDIDDNKLKITQPLSGEYMMNQNIYITSDEEIKERDWIFNEELEPSVLKCSGQGSLRGWNKIILTTDIDLIKDSVQVIDDKFLEWFVKNPNCEEVEIKTRYLHSYKTGETFISFSKTPEFSSRNMQCIKIEPRYEIIIPQEKPKQENCCTPAGQIKRYVDCVGCDKKPKQMSKPTAVDYLFNELIANPGNFIKAYKQAKEMEKEQIIDAFKEGNLYHGWALKHEPEQYYNETYKKNK
jgi:hypothetical protein